MGVTFFNLDIEPTNRCNAHCYFCPRDQTPHQGLMTPEVFDKALERTGEFNAFVTERFGAHLKVNLCGLGEPLLNRLTPDFVRKIRDAGFECSLSTNGTLLDEKRSRALLDAGLQGAEINIGEQGEDYERIYGLPFDQTCERIMRFAEWAGDQCQVRIVLVDHRNDREHIQSMMQFWRDRGLTHFLPFHLMNRGGSLFVDEMQYASLPERAEADALLAARKLHPVCPVPLVFPFIGYDGQYYLCCSDWKKEVAFGSVFETSFIEIAAAKLERVAAREPICKNCNHDPVNQLTDKLRGRTAGEDFSIDEFVDGIAEIDGIAREVTEAMVMRAGERGPAGRGAAPDPCRRRRRLNTSTFKSRAQPFQRGVPATPELPDPRIAPDLLVGSRAAVGGCGGGDDMRLDAIRGTGPRGVGSSPTNPWSPCVRGRRTRRPRCSASTGRSGRARGRRTPPRRRVPRPQPSRDTRPHGRARLPALRATVRRRRPLRRARTGARPRRSRAMSPTARLRGCGFGSNAKIRLP